MTFIATEVVNGVATLAVNRPQSGNALNLSVFAQLTAALDELVAQAEVHAIVLTGEGNKFCSGADLGAFVRYLEARDFDRIVEVVRTSQMAFEKIASCPKPIVAAVGGAAVGGGVELALACHRIVATPRASFSFPETSLGILPFSGGTYRVPRRVGPALCKWIVYAGPMLPPPKALAMGFVDELAMPADLMTAAQATARSLAASPESCEWLPKEPPNELAAMASLFSAATVEELLAADVSADRALAKAQAAAASRPPATLQWGDKLIDEAGAQTTQQGAEAALAAVPELFRDPAVYEAMTRIAQQQRQS